MSREFLARCAFVVVFTALEGGLGYAILTQSAGWVAAAVVASVLVVLAHLATLLVSLPGMPPPTLEHVALRGQTLGFVVALVALPAAVVVRIVGT